MWPFSHHSEYHVRIFDHNHLIREKYVGMKGQSYLTITVFPKFLGVLGQEVKLAFMINPEIPPREVNGNFEIDYDVRDALPMADIIEVCPDLVAEIQESYDYLKKIDLQLKEAEQQKSEEDATREALATAASPLDLLTDEPGGNVITVQPVNVKLGKKLSEEEIEAENLAGQLYKATKNAVSVAKIIKRIKDTPEEKRKEIKDDIQDFLDFCERHPGNPVFWWLKDYLDIGKEVEAIVCQKLIWRFGVMPDYYLKQSNAPISEKIFSLPPEKPSTVMLIVMCVLGIAGVIGLVLIAFFLTHH